MDMLILYGQSNPILNLERLAEECSLDISQMAFAGLCCGLSSLSHQQKEVGVILIDLGAGTTDFAVYADKLVIAAGSLGVGGDHVTNDLAVALNLSTTQAERLKTNYGAAMVDLTARGRRIPVTPEGGFRAQEVMSRDVNTVIHARMEEILQLVKKRIGNEVLNRNFGAGVVLTGGGAKMTRVQDLASSVFEMPCHLGGPKHVSGLALPAENPEFASTVGMLQLGWRMMKEEDRPRAFGGLLRKVFGK
jgi:cell division protein FtsA